MWKQITFSYTTSLWCTKWIGNLWVFSDCTHTYTQHKQTAVKDVLSRFDFILKISNVCYVKSTKLIASKCWQYFKQDLSFMHVNFAKDLTTQRVLKFCCFIHMLITLFSCLEHDTSGVLQNPFYFYQGFIDYFLF